MVPPAPRREPPRFVSLFAAALPVREGRRLPAASARREFDPVTAPEQNFDLPLAQRRAGGLGIHLLRAFVSEIRHERLGGRNILRLRI